MVAENNQGKADRNISDNNMNDKDRRGKERESAIASLITSYQTKHSKNSNAASFFVSPSIAFVSTDDYGSISVLAQDDTTIRAGTVVLAIPQQERISTYTRDKSLQKTLRDLETTFKAKADAKVTTTAAAGESSRLHDIFDYGEIALAVVLMQALGASKGDKVAQDASLLSKVLQTWPTLGELRGCCSIWEPSSEFNTNHNSSVSAWDLLKGTYTVEILRLTYTAHRFIFDEMVLPVLERHNMVDKLTAQASTSTTGTPENSGPNSRQNKLWELYLHASYLVRSRAYEDSQTKAEMIPLLDLFNGLATSCDSKVNARIDHSSKDVTVTTTGDITKGTELIVSYGDHSITGFISRYGFCPQEMIMASGGGQQVTDDVLLRLPQSLGPQERTRVWACQELRYPTTPQEINEYKCFLPNASLSKFSKLMQANTLVLMGGQNDRGTFSEGDIGQTYYRQVPRLPALHQYLELCHMASEQEVIYAANTRQLMVEGANELHVAHMFQLVVDYTLTETTDLNSSTNESDLQQAISTSNRPDLVVAYRARICQRDTLAQWRHAFCQRHGFPSEHAEAAYYPKYMQGKFKDHLLLPNLDKPKAPQCLLASGGCRFCGRTLKLLSCGKCKIMKYCSKEHQKADWKYHKKLCDPSLAS